METPPGESLAWPWPFSRADLTAGLRRYLGKGDLQVLEVRPTTIARRRPSIGIVRGLLVRHDGAPEGAFTHLVVKEPRGTTRTGLAGAGRREVGVYHTLAGQLPLNCPALVASSPSGDWLLLEAVPPARDAARWEGADYLQAIDNLVWLHDRFWGLGEDLNAFTWLSRPLTNDFQVHRAAAEHAVEQIRLLGEPRSLAQSPPRMKLLERLIEAADQIVIPLRQLPPTLLHGDYWPGNISVTSDGRQVVYDWQLAAVGPFILDLVVFMQKIRWWFPARPLPDEQLIAHYRQLLAERTKAQWDDAVWQSLWDRALIWRFLQEWVDLMAASPDSLLITRAAQLEEVWLDPLERAASRTLGWK